MLGVDYQEVDDWGVGGSVRKDIVILAKDCTRERLIALAKHLSLRFVLNPVVIVS